MGIVIGNWLPISEAANDGPMPRGGVERPDRYLLKKQESGVTDRTEKDKSLTLLYRRKWVRPIRRAARQLAAHLVLRGFMK
jgi:hypothetical protein